MTLKVRRADFKLVTRAYTLSNYFDTEKTIFLSAKKLLLKHKFLDHPVRLIGVNVSKLRPKQNPEYDDLLVGYEPERKNKKLDELLDKLRDKHGEESIFFAGSIVF